MEVHDWDNTLIFLANLREKYYETSNLLASIMHVPLDQFSQEFGMECKI